MKARCIDTSDSMAGLTLGKVYDVEECPRDDDMYSLVDDEGDTVQLFKTRFEPLKESTSEEINEPSRYTTKTGKQIKHLIRDELLPEDIDPYEAALLFNVYKYLFRYPNKQPIDSLKKAKNYIDDIILEIEGREKDV